MVGIILGVLYIVDRAFFAHGNLFDDTAAKVARYRCCVIQLDSMDSAGHLFHMSAVRKLYDGYAEKI